MSIGSKGTNLGYIALMLSNYFHDLAVAVLATNVIAIHVIGRHLEAAGGGDDVLARLVGALSRVTWWALAYVILAGAVRAWFFLDFEWNPLVPRSGMLVALGVKHVLLFGLTIFGIVGMRRYSRRFGSDGR